jgi:hypothetical protein
MSKYQDKFMIFCGNFYYPSGGMCDFLVSLYSAYACIDALERDRTVNGFEWFHIFAGGVEVFDSRKRGYSPPDRWGSKGDFEDFWQIAYHDALDAMHGYLNYE